MISRASDVSYSIHLNTFYFLIKLELEGEILDLYCIALQGAENIARESEYCTKRLLTSCGKVLSQMPLF